MKFVYILIFGFLRSALIHAHDSEMPEELKRLGYCTTYIPEELGRKYGRLETVEEKIKYHKNHPIFRYDFSNMHLNEMERQFEYAEALEKEQQSWSAWVGFKVVENPLKIYLVLAEEGYGWANRRLAQAFRNGELGLSINQYWEKVFSGRPCDPLNMRRVKQSFEAALRRLEAEQRGEIKPQNCSDEGSDSDVEQNVDSLSDDTASTERLSEELVAEKMSFTHPNLRQRRNNDMK